MSSADEALEAEIRQWADPIHWGLYSVVISVGLARGILPRVVREQTDLPIIIYDPRLPRSAPVSDWPRVYGVTDIPTLRREVRTVLRRDERRPLMVHSDTADPDLTEEQETVRRAVEQTDKIHAIEQRSARTSMLFRTAVFLRSVPHLADLVPINHVTNRLDGTPAICVGGGPSLDRQIDAIAQIRDRVLLIATNTSAPALRAAGMVPDLVVTCEAKDIIVGMADSVRGTVLVPGIHVHPGVWDLPAERIAPALSAEGPFGRWLCEAVGVRPIDIGGSSGTLTAGVAQALGCDPIILVGQDCCSDPETGELYAARTQWAGTRIDIQDGQARMERSVAKQAADQSLAPERLRAHLDMPEEHLVQVPSWDGSGEVCCHGPYDALRQWWEESASVGYWQDRRLVNASVGGARLWGWESRRIEDLDLPRAETPPGQRIRAALDDARVVPGATLREALEAQRASIGVSRELATEARGLVRRLREIQLELAEQSPATDLLESYTWGQFETDRIHGDDEPLFDRMAVLLDDLATGAEAVDKLIAEVLESI